MSISFPSSLDNFVNPSPSDKLKDDNLALRHSTQHSDLNDAVEVLEAKVGINNSSIVSSHDYKISNIAQQIYINFGTVPVSGQSFTP